MTKNLGRLASKAFDLFMVGFMLVTLTLFMIYLLQLLWTDPVVFLKVMGTLGVCALFTKVLCLIHDLTDWRD